MNRILNNISWRRRFFLLLIPFFIVSIVLLATTALALHSAEVRILKDAAEANDLEAIADVARANETQSPEVARVAAGFAPSRADEIAGAVACAVSPEYAADIAATVAKAFPELATQIAIKCKACVTPEFAEKIDHAVAAAIVVEAPETPPGVPPTHYHQ